jgi:LPXTG-site transpeptidase (sortase) family protein
MVAAGMAPPGAGSARTSAGSTRTSNGSARTSARTAARASAGSAGAGGDRVARLWARRRRRRWRTLGAVFLCAGLALLLTAGYDLWGTGLGTARAQAGIRTEIRRHGLRAEPIPGGADGFLAIPRIHLDMAFVEGVDPGALALGPGHYPGTPMPGQGGNVAIAGHRTTHLAPFWSLDELRPGDRIDLRTAEGRFVYRVLWVGVGLPDSSWVLAPTADPSLTLTTCNPRFSAGQRLVVRAIQVLGPVPGGFLDHLRDPPGSWLAPPLDRAAGRVA